MSSTPPPPGRDWGRLLARVLCAVFGLLGALPMVIGFAAKSQAAQEWATQRTQQALLDSLELQATYTATVRLFPLRIDLEGLTVESSDGGDPAFAAERVSITPRIFSMIAGRIDVGDIEIEAPKHRIVFRDGELQNVHVRLPESTQSEADVRAPFSSLSLTDASFDVRLDGAHFDVNGVDLDVFPDADAAFEVALRMGESRVRLDPELYPPGAGATPWDADVICQLDARVRIEPESTLVRRLSVLGSADIDPRPGTEPDCRRQEEQPEDRVALRASQFRVTPASDVSPWLLQGDVMLRVPLDVANRYTAAGPFRGWLGLSGKLRYDGGSRLPQFHGNLKMSEFSLGSKRLMQGAEGLLELRQDRIFIPEIRVQYGGGSVLARDTVFSPFEPGLPFVSGYSLIERVPFPAMMANLDVTDDAIVQFTIERATVTDFEGTLHPTKLDGEIDAEVTGFQIFDRSHKSPARKRMFGLNSKGFTRGIFAVRPDSVQFNDQLVRFGQSVIKTSVKVGFESEVTLQTWESKIDLADVSPLVTVPMKGLMRFDSKMDSPGGNLTLMSNLSIDDLEFGGFPIGDIERSKLVFSPLWIEMEDTVVRKGESRAQLPRTRFDFETGASVEVDAQISADNLRIRDFLAMWRLDEDPRWRDLSGRLSSRARVHYVLGGKADPCGEGNLRVGGSLDFDQVALFGESYDGGHSEFELHWHDILASYHGMSLDVPSFQLKKGNGSLLGNFKVSPGAALSGNLVATAVPLARLDALGELGKIASGSLTSVIQVKGTLDEIEAEAQVNVGSVAVGRSQLPPSQLHVSLKPRRNQVRYVEGLTTGCGRRVPEAESPEQKGDPVTGTFGITGELFGGQVALDDFSITRQNAKVARGNVRFNKLKLRPMLDMSPEIALLKQRPNGVLSGSVSVERLPLLAPNLAVARATIDELSLDWRGLKASVDPKPELELRSGRLRVTDLTLRVAPEGGDPITLDVSGELARLGKNPSLDYDIGLRPVQLSGFTGLLPSSRKVEGKLDGKVRVTGNWNSPSYAGGLRLVDGSFDFRGSPLAITDVDVELRLENAGLSISSATAQVGGGTVSASGSFPLRGFRFEQFRGQLNATNVAIPITRGVDLTVDAELEASWEPVDVNEEERALPKIAGEVAIRSFEYSRAVTMNADIATLTGRPKRTQFESYDPDKDVVELDVLVTSQGSMKLNNNLIEASLRLDPPGLRLTGTNQRFGLRGDVKVVPGGRIRLRRNEFEIQSGEVQFDDATRIAPRVDVTAVTEYRRFSNTTSTGASSTAAASTSGASAAGSTAGQWRINMHAYGDAENLKLDLTSQPKLSQDDIFLLLTVGLTRAELDQAQSASLGESVALEALGSLTGADSAVSEAIPAIDEFRFGSSYSARTGRTEPTVTVGKRLSERIRAYVTSGISESREVRSNLEWRLNKGVSVEGSYDNVNDVSSSSLGNLGADVRWRLEFE